jgi:phospholipase C
MAYRLNASTQTPPRTLFWIAIMSLISFILTVWVACLCTTTPIIAGSLADIDHVVLFMQENRAFDHVIYIHQISYTHAHIFFQYFGTMAGVRGFSDPNVKITNGKPVWYQYVLHT